MEKFFTFRNYFAKSNSYININNINRCVGEEKEYGRGEKKRLIILYR